MQPGGPREGGGGLGGPTAALLGSVEAVGRTLDSLAGRLRETAEGLERGLPPAEEAGTDPRAAREAYTRCLGDVREPLRRARRCLARPPRHPVPVRGPSGAGAGACGGSWRGEPGGVPAQHRGAAAHDQPAAAAARAVAGDGRADPAASRMALGDRPPRRRPPSAADGAAAGGAPGAARPVHVGANRLAVSYAERLRVGRPA